MADLLTLQSDNQSHSTLELAESLNGLHVPSVVGGVGGAQGSVHRCSVSPVRHTYAAVSQPAAWQHWPVSVHVRLQGQLVTIVSNAANYHDFLCTGGLGVLLLVTVVTVAAHAAVTTCREDLDVLAAECSRRLEEMDGADVGRVLEGFASLG